MRTLKVIAGAAALSMLVGSAAFAAERTTNSATLVNPFSQAYVATFTQDCGPTGARSSDAYVGVYLWQSFQVQGKAFLSIEAGNAIAFSTSSRANGEEGWVSEIGGESRIGCLPVGTKLFLLDNPGMGNLPIRVLAEGTIK
jgi:hypothetical protein